ncbi:hypothetical protein [Streptomyces sp. NPDC042319]|uniref:hypothetical protein n=1 Tax=Streptomyces sp. NPDC042319 TaxID=3154332 RepID=UPI0033D2BD5B
MTHPHMPAPQPDPADEHEEHWRDEITTAMTHVIRACQDVVREHSHHGRWTPEGTEAPAGPNHYELIDEARHTVLNKLQLATRCAETVAYEIERHRQRVRHSQPSIGPE